MATTTLTTHKEKPSHTGMDPTYFKQETAKILSELEKAMLTPGYSNIAIRMSRATRVYNLMMEYSISFQQACFYGQTMNTDFDAQTYFYKEFLQVTTKVAKKIIDQKMASASSGGGKVLVLQDLKALDDLWTELKRLVIAEACATLQYADIHLQVKDQPVDVKQELFDCFRSCWTSQLETKATQCLLEGLNKHRLSDMSCYLDQCKSCLSLCYYLTEKSQRAEKERSMQQLYLTALKQWLLGVRFTNVRDYIPLVDKLLDDELKRSQKLFNSKEFNQQTKLLMQTALIGQKADSMIKDPQFGVVAVLNYPHLREVEFARLFNVFEFSMECVQQMQTAVCSSVTAAGIKVLSSGFSIPNILALRASYAKLLTTCIPQHQALDFHLALQMGITECLPTDGTFEEGLSAFLDKIIRSKASNVQQQIINALEALPLVSNVELFMEHYKRALSLRLLGLKGTTNFSLEKFTIGRLTVSRGSTFTKHFVTMFDEASAEASNLCNALVWPQHFDSLSSSEGTRAKYVPEIQKQFDAFILEQNKKQKQWAVWVEPSLCTVEVNFQPLPNGPSTTIVGTADQINLVCGAFENGGGEPKNYLTLEEICEKCGYKDGNLVTLLLSALVGAKLLSHNPVNKNYALNSKFVEVVAAGNKKVVLPTIGIAKMGKFPPGMFKR